MEKLSDGRTVVRSEVAEDRAARKHELQHQRHVETLLAKLQQETENESSGIVYFLFEKPLTFRYQYLGHFCLHSPAFLLPALFADYAIQYSNGDTQL